MALSFLSRTKFNNFNYSIYKYFTSTPQIISNPKLSFTSQIKKSSNLSKNPPQTHYRKQISLANLLQRYGFPSSQLHGFLTKNKFLLDFNVLELENCLKILLFSFKLHQNVLVLMICSCPSVLDLGFLRKWEVGFVLFGSLGGCVGVVRSVLEFSRRFEIDPDEFFSCVGVLKGFGFSDGTVGRVLEEFPGVVMIDETELQKRIDFWGVLGLGSKAIDGVYMACPGALRFNVEKRLKPLVDEFLEMGFSLRLVRQEIVREPRIVCLEAGELRQCVELLKRLKCRVSIKEKIFSEGEFKAGFSVKLMVDCLNGYGLTRRDALNILKREPRSIIYGIDDIEKKIEFLLQRMNRGIDSLIDVPEYLGMHFDKQIVPRYNVVEHLMSRGALGFEVGLRDIVKPSRLKFYNFFVKPYPECEKMYGRFSEYVDTKPRHPTGLWKVFKPPKFPESKADVRNVKSFMEALV